MASKKCTNAKTPKRKNVMTMIELTKSLITKWESDVWSDSEQQLSAVQVTRCIFLCFIDYLLEEYCHMEYDETNFLYSILFSF